MFWVIPSSTEQVTNHSPVNGNAMMFLLLLRYTGAPYDTGWWWCSKWLTLFCPKSDSNIGCIDFNTMIPKADWQCFRLDPMQKVAVPTNRQRKTKPQGGNTSVSTLSCEGRAIPAVPKSKQRHADVSASSQLWTVLEASGLCGKPG